MPSQKSAKPLQHIRILSLALNLPGPAALMRLKALGASCTKLEGPGGDPMQHYAPPAYAQLHRGIKRIAADLKTPRGLQRLHDELARTDVLLSSFRPSAFKRLGISWTALKKAYPRLSWVSIVGDTSAPEIPGHDLTYLAEQGLINGTALPPTLYADMGGSLLAVEAVLAAVLQAEASGQGVHTQVGLAQAAQYLALPRHWGLTTAQGAVGGAHAMYQVLPCQDGRVALAALEPHFAARLCALIGWPLKPAQDVLQECLRPTLKAKLAAFIKKHTCKQLQALAQQHDLPLQIMHNKL
jgi:alpha-methylacyl-CoA racemase